jgi:poly-gamma-glutamate synthesis protein (capsule biosynthesis protein)
MENLSPRKKGRNSLTVFLFFGLGIVGLWVLSLNWADSKKHDLSPQLVISQPPAVLIFVGDLMLSRGVELVMKKTDDWAYPFRLIAHTLREADLTFGNLENPISSRGVNLGSVYSFRADPRSVTGLKLAGFDVLSIANNHLWDYGGEAFLDTMAILRSAGIDFVGGGLNYDEAHQPVIKTVYGTKIAYLGYTNLLPAVYGSKTASPASALLDLNKVIEDIKKAKTEADIVIVSVHWGEEYQSSANDYQKQVGRALVTAGASLVVGHHPHVIQEVEHYQGGWIAYSLGNFVFDQNFSKETQEGLLLKVKVEEGKVTKVEPLKIRINYSFQPFLVEN